MTIRIRSAVLIALTTTGLFASSITYENTNSSVAGQSFEVGIPLFDGSLGTLDSVNWSLSEGQLIGIIVDNCSGLPPTEEPYSYAITGGVTVSVLDATVDSTTSGSGFTLGTCPGGGVGLGISQHLTASGTLSDPSAFIGSGTAQVAIDPFATGSFDIGLPDGGGFDIVDTSVDLTVTYTYTSTPEPGMLPLLLSLAGALLLFSQRRKAHSR
jgi:hypothetical protein